MLENARIRFMDTIDVRNSPFRSDYGRELSRLSGSSKSSAFKLGPEAMIAPLIHALESPVPRARYRVTIPTLVGAWLKRLLPTTMMDRVLQQITVLGKKAKVYPPSVEPNAIQRIPPASRILPHSLQHMVIKSQHIPEESLVDQDGFIREAVDFLQGQSAILQAAENGAATFSSKIKSEKSAMVHDG